MTRPDLAYRWSRDEFVLAWEAGAFDQQPGALRDVSTVSKVAIGAHTFASHV